MADRTKCVAVIPGGSCPECGWSFEKPYIDGGNVPEPHPVLPHGSPKELKVTSLCANCGAPWNLDAVKCSKCDFLPAQPEMQDKLTAEKNALRRVQGLQPLPPRAQPITNTADAHE